MEETKNDSSTAEQPKPGRSVPVEEFTAEALGADHPLVRPLTEEEIQIKARREDIDRWRAASLEYWRKIAEPHLEQANRLLYWHEAPEEEIARLNELKRLPHYGDEPLPRDGEEDTHRCNRKCWAWLLQPLAFWPSDLIRIYGPELLFHPLIVQTIQHLSRVASDPLLVHNPDPLRITAENLLRQELEGVPEQKHEARRQGLLANAKKKAEGGGFVAGDPLRELGFSAIRSLPADLREELALRDETEDRERSAEARSELQRIFALLAGRRTGKRRSHRFLRTFLEFEDRRGRRLQSKKIVADMSRELGRTETAILSDLNRARRLLGRRTIPKHHRGRFRDP